MINYDNVTLIPRILSELNHRSEADTSFRYDQLKLQIPLIASPMPDVCNGEMAVELSGLGALGIIHRFQSIEEEVKQYLYDSDQIELPFNYAGCAIGVTGDYFERLQTLYNAGCRIFCLDTANGFNLQTKYALEKLRNEHSDLFLIGGNVATLEGFKFLSELGFDAVRVGIAGGCFTPEMKVITSGGLRKIEDVFIGDFVLSHDGTFHLVSNKFEFERNEEIAVINGIKCTLNHEFFVINVKDKDMINDENYLKYGQWITAKEILKDPSLYLFIDIAGGSNHERKEESLQTMQEINVA